MNTTTAHRPPHRRLALLLLLTTASASLLTPAGAQSPVVAPVPSVINYQGRVTDGTGLPIGATGTPAAPVPGVTNRKIIFRIYDAATGGTRLWTEEQTVTIATGEFSVLLGSGINATGTAAGESRPSLEAVFNSISSTPGGARFLEIMVDEGGGTIDGSDVPISPRQQLTTTAYSFRARSADSIASGTDLQLNGSSDYGLGYYGTGRQFNGTSVNGPVLYGQGGGALGSVNGAAQSVALRWDGSNAVNIGGALTVGTISGNGAALTNISDGALSTNIARRNAANTFTGAIAAPSFSGNGAALTNLSDGALSANVALLNRATQSFSGKVGIGGASVTTPLEITGNATEALKINSPASGGVGLYHTQGSNSFSTVVSSIETFLQSPNQIALVSGGSVRLMVKSTGKVGIGTVSPAGILHVAGVETSQMTLGNPAGVTFAVGNNTGQYGMNFGVNGNGTSWIQGGRTDGIDTAYDIHMQSSGGAVKVNNKFVPVGEENLRIIRGNVSSVGGIQQGTGFTVTKLSTGNYRIHFTEYFPGNPTVTANCRNQQWDNFVGIVAVTVSYVDLRMVDGDLSSEQDTDFSFIAIGPR